MLDLNRLNPPQEVSVFNHKRGTLFRDGEEPVYILQDGRFVVKRDGEWMAFKTLETLDKTKRKANDCPPLQLMQLSYGEVVVKEVVAWGKGSKLVLADGKTLYANWDREWRLYDAKKAAEYKKLQEWKAAQEAIISTKEEAFANSLTAPLTPETFREAQLELFKKGKPCPPKS